MDSGSLGAFSQKTENARCLRNQTEFLELMEAMTPTAGRDHRRAPVILSVATTTIGSAGKLGKL
jgi:hypothetical protein